MEAGYGYPVLDPEADEDVFQQRRPDKSDGRNKIFVGGLKQCTQEVFNEYFSLYGELVDSVVMVDKATGKPRGFGFVQYATEDAAEAVMADYEVHSLDGNRVEVKRCVPREAAANASPLHGGMAPAQHMRAPILLQRPTLTMPARRPHAPVEAAKIFVGGLAAETTTAGLTAYFSQYGELIDSVVMVDKLRGCPRGFGFVTYDNAASADLVMQVDRHELDGRMVEVKRCVPRSIDSSMGLPPLNGRSLLPPRPSPIASPREFRPSLPVFPSALPMTTDKVFIGGLGECHEDDLLNYFGQFGTIVDVVVMKDKATGKSRGFGFVQFDNPAAVDGIMQYGQARGVNGRNLEVSGLHQLNGVQVEVKRSIPKESMGRAMVGAPTMHPSIAQYQRVAPTPQFQPSVYQPPVFQPSVYQPPPMGLYARPSAAPSSSQPSSSDKVFVGGLDTDTSLEEFVDYFSQFGNLVDQVVMKDKLTGKSRGFGFVKYDDPSAVDLIMEHYSEHQIKGKWVEVKRAQPEAKGGDKGLPKGGGKGRFIPY